MKGIDFHGATPNHQANSKCPNSYGKDYTWQPINIMKNTQKEPWFTAVGPNGRIPAIVDHDRGDFAVFEGLAILSYLTKHYDPDHKLSFPYDSDDHSVAEQWMAWQHGGLGPMQGQANHFLRFAKDRIPYATQRYVGETERLYGVLEARLASRDFLAGPGRGRFSIADIASLGWANVAYFSGVDLSQQFPNVQAWFERCWARPGVQRGFAIPSPSRISNDSFKRRLAEGEDGLQEQEDKLKQFLDEAKKQYNYKYASP